MTVLLDPRLPTDHVCVDCHGQLVLEPAPQGVVALVETCPGCGEYRGKVANEVEERVA